MTIAQQFAAKASVAFVAAAMIISLMAPAAQAQSADELQAMINTLMAQIAALQGQVGQGASGVASGVCPYTWTRDLSQGSTGPDVMKLQQFLNADADTRVAASGAGSVGAETEYYGPATAAAVSKMQVKYRAEVLSPAGLVNPTGFFGPSSRAKANSVCVAAPVVTVPDVDEDMDEDEMEDEDDMVELRGEADLDSVDVEDADEDTVEEGDVDAPIASLQVEFSNGDAEINRIDLRLKAAAGNGESDPWDVFETISLWVDGDKVAEVDAGSRNDYLNRSNGTLRFSGLNIVAMEDEELEIVVGAEIKSTVRDLGASDDWEISLVGMRYFDADGVSDSPSVSASGASQSILNGGFATIRVEEAGEGQELRFSLASTNPSAADILVDTDSRTNGVNVLVANLRADDGDIEIDRLVVDVLTTGALIANVVNDVRIVVDGKTFRKDGNPVAIGTSTLRYLFDIDYDVEVEDGDTARAEVLVDFQKQSGNYNNGQTVRANFVVASTTAEGNGGNTPDFKGSAISEIHKLVAEGIVASLKSAATPVITNKDNSPQTSTGEFRMQFEITAVEETMWIPQTVVRNTWTNEGILFRMLDNNFAQVNTGTTTPSFSRVSGGTVEGNFVRIEDGETATFELVVTFDPAAQGAFRLEAMAIGYNDVSAAAANKAYNLLPASDYRTPVSGQINN